MKCYLVTGANKGVGFAIVKQILQDIDDAFVFLACRSASRGADAVSKLVENNDASAKQIQLVQMDVADEDSVAGAAKFIKQEIENNPELECLEAIVNNAGIDGDFSMREILDVNAFGVLRVSEAFIPLLNRNHGRIINISSAAGPAFVAQCNEKYRHFLMSSEISLKQVHDLADTIAREYDSHGKIENSKLMEMGIPYEKASKSYIPYQLSKALCNSITMILARAHPKLIINSCTPGFTATDMTVELFADGDFGKAYLMGMQSLEEATVSTLHLLTTDDTTSGEFYDAKGCPGSLCQARDGY